MLLLWSTVSWFMLDAAAQQQDYFPLSVGTYWVYRATLDTEAANGILKKTITWKMEVLERVEHPLVTGYRLRGHPSDLAFYEEGKQPGEYAILQVGPNRFYKVDVQRLLRLKDKDDFLGGLVKEEELVFDFPLMDHKKFCRSDSITRRDYQYCWFVDDEQPFRRSIPGVPQSSSMSEVSLRFVTNPDEVHILFVPGLGITRYEYQHHGSPSAVEAELIEYHKAAAPR
jgi:hypothetical protein